MQAGDPHIQKHMHGKGNYRFKVINGVLSWKNKDMDRFMPVSPEILTRVVLLYENQLKTGISIWKSLEKNDEPGLHPEDPLFQDLANWMEDLKEIFADTDPFREKINWSPGAVHLN